MVEFYNIDIITMTDNNVKFGFAIGFLLLMGCSTLTINKINEPSKENFKKELKNTLDEDMSKEEAIFNFKRRLDTRIKILDSLKIVSKRKIIIIDRLSHNYAGEYEENYFFYDNDFLWIQQPQYDPVIESYLVKSNKKEDLKNFGNEDIISIYNHFNINNFELIKGNINYKSSGNSAFSHFYITVVINNKVRYYETRSQNGFKIIKL